MWPARALFLTVIILEAFTVANPIPAVIEENENSLAEMDKRLMPGCSIDWDVCYFSYQDARLVADCGCWFSVIIRNIVTVSSVSIGPMMGSDSLTRRFEMVIIEKALCREVYGAKCDGSTCEMCDRFDTALGLTI